MIEIKISGRGGQGAVLASQMLAQAFFDTGLQVQAFPSFGAERRGAPVSAFLRTDDEPITLRCAVEHPDWIILFDDHLLGNPMIMDGVTAKTILVVNTPLRPLVDERLKSNTFYHVDASAIAAALGLQTSAFAMVNTAMAGAFARASRLMDLDSLTHAIRALVPIKADANVAAAEAAYKHVKEYADA